MTLSPKSDDDGGDDSQSKSSPSSERLPLTSTPIKSDSNNGDVNENDVQMMDDDSLTVNSLTTTNNTTNNDNNDIVKQHQNHQVNEKMNQEDSVIMMNSKQSTIDNDEQDSYDDNYDDCGNDGDEDVEMSEETTKRETMTIAQSVLPKVDCNKDENVKKEKEELKSERVPNETSLSIGSSILNNNASLNKDCFATNIVRSKYDDDEDEDEDIDEDHNYDDDEVEEEEEEEENDNVQRYLAATSLSTKAITITTTSSITKANTITTTTIKNIANTEKIISTISGNGGSDGEHVSNRPSYQNHHNLNTLSTVSFSEASLSSSPPLSSSSSSDLQSTPEQVHVGRRPLHSAPCNLKVLIDEKILSASMNALTCEIMGQKFIGDLLPNGYIRMSGTTHVFSNPNSWVHHCMRTLAKECGTPTSVRKDYGSAWSVIRYDGKRLDSYKLRWYRKQKKNSLVPTIGGSGFGDAFSGGGFGGFNFNAGGEIENNPLMMMMMHNGGGAFRAAAAAAAAAFYNNSITSTTTTSSTTTTTTTTTTTRRSTDDHNNLYHHYQPNSSTNSTTNSGGGRDGGGSSVQHNPQFSTSISYHRQSPQHQQLRQSQHNSINGLTNNAITTSSSSNNSNSTNQYHHRATATTPTNISNSSSSTTTPWQKQYQQQLQQQQQQLQQQQLLLQQKFSIPRDQLYKHDKHSTGDVKLNGVLSLYQQSQPQTKPQQQSNKPNNDNELTDTIPLLQPSLDAVDALTTVTSTSTTSTTTVTQSPIVVTTSVTTTNNDLIQFSQIDLTNLDTLDERTKVIAAPFNSIYCLQPFKVHLTTNVLMIVDFHAHLLDAEVYGYLGGTWEMSKSLLTIDHVYPTLTRTTTTTTTNDTKDPTDPASTTTDSTATNAIITEEFDEQLEAANQTRIDVMKRDLVEKNRILVGWYHSHPHTVPHPSVGDIKRQISYQKQMIQCSKQMIVQQYTPIVALIVSPYDARQYHHHQKQQQHRRGGGGKVKQQNRKSTTQQQQEHLTSLVQMCWVMPLLALPQCSDFGRPMQLHYEIIRDPYITTDMLKQMRDLALECRENDRFIRFNTEYNDTGIRYYDKLKATLKNKMPQDLLAMYDIGNADGIDSVEESIKRNGNNISNETSGLRQALLHFWKFIEGCILPPSESESSDAEAESGISCSGGGGRSDEVHVIKTD